MPKNRKNRKKGEKKTNVEAKLKRACFDTTLSYISTLQNEMKQPHNMGRASKEQITILSERLTHAVTRLTVFVSQTHSPVDLQGICRAFCDELGQGIYVLRSLLQPSPCSLNTLVIEAVSNVLNDLSILVSSMRQNISRGSPMNPQEAGSAWEKLKALQYLPATCSAAAAKRILDSLQLIRDASQEFSKFKVCEPGKEDEEDDDDDLNFDDFNIEDFDDDDDDDGELTPEEFKLVDPCSTLIKLCYGVMKQVAGFLLQSGDGNDDEDFVQWFEELVSHSNSMCVLTDNLVAGLYPPHDQKTLLSNTRSLTALLEQVTESLEASPLFVRVSKKKKKKSASKASEEKSKVVEEQQKENSDTGSCEAAKSQNDQVDTDSKQEEKKEQQEQQNQKQETVAWISNVRAGLASLDNSLFPLLVSEQPQ